MRHMPWDDIKVPRNDFNIRLAEGSGKIPVYWGRAPEGNCLLIIELLGDHSSQFHKEIVPIKGIDINLRQNTSALDIQHLVLALERQIDRDIFASLCETMISVLSPVNEPNVALEVLFEHLKRWKIFLSGRKSRLLSAEEVRGIFGELYFLRQLYRKFHFSHTLAVNAWYGPEKTHHDFIFGSDAVEIKTISGRERNSVRVSSEDQLESGDENLFLKIYRLGEIPGHDDNLSLNGAVEAIYKELSGTDALENFQKKLAEAGYLPFPDYDKPEFQVVQEKTYRISDKFPCLVRSELPEGVIRVSYEIKLEHIKAFEIENSLIFDR
jgi:hypothetical protein